MNLKEMNNMDPTKIPYSALTLALTNAVEHLVSQLIEANEHLKSLAYPPIAFNADINTADLSDLEFHRGRLTVMDDRSTLRDQFAIAALAAIISRGDLDTEMNVLPYCQDAYTIADAMLEARRKQEGKCS